MKLKIIVGIFAFLLLGGTVTPAISQTAPVTGIVINEVEINPPGNDTFSPIEWIELFNPTDTAVDISGWQISTSPSRDNFRIPQGTIISQGEFLLFFYTSAWFTDVAQVVQLLDEQGNVIDETPPFTDVFNDTSSWQRKADGFDTDSPGDWINKFSTPGKTISKVARAEQQASDLEVSLSADKDAYLFGETARISGEVSKIVYIRKPTFQTDTIDVKITGPGGYSNDLNLFPDYNLRYRTTLKLDSVLEINAGVYNISAEYGGVTTSTQFTVGHALPDIEQKVIGLLSITT
ncbi:MAG: lamin tail domain-containing protein, partial [Nitrosopumilaceae archaeon]